MMMLFFIYAKRFDKYLPTLIQIDKDCNSKLYSITRRINDVFQDDPNLNDILRFVNDIYEHGQTVYDFNRINYAVWEEVDQEIKPENTERELIKKMIDKMNERDEIQKQYSKKYPGERW